MEGKIRLAVFGQKRLSREGGIGKKYHPSGCVHG